MTILWSRFQSAGADDCCSEGGAGCLRKRERQAALAALDGEIREESLVLTGAWEGESPRSIPTDGSCYVVPPTHRIASRDQIQEDAKPD